MTVATEMIPGIKEKTDGKITTGSATRGVMYHGEMVRGMDETMTRETEMVAATATATVEGIEERTGTKGRPRLARHLQVLVMARPGHLQVGLYVILMYSSEKC